jgi:hypothetical protein
LHQSGAKCPFQEIAGAQSPDKAGSETRRPAAQSEQDAIVCPIHWGRAGLGEFFLKTRKQILENSLSSDQKHMHVSSLRRA